MGLISCPNSSKERKRTEGRSKGEVKKAKAQMGLDLVRDIKGNKKGFYKYI